MKLSKVFGIVLSLHVGVILLVMFQPSCQTTGGKAKLPQEEQGSIPSDSPEQTFNQGIEGVDEPLVDQSKVENKSEEFVVPQRPAPGELIVPKEDSAPLGPSPSIIVPTEQAVLPLELKPSDLAIYKVVRGDTLWGIARKNGVSLANLLKANPNLDKSGRLAIGQEIMIPGSGAASATNLTEEVVSDSPVSLQSGNSYTVEKGDTLSRIARGLNIRLSELLKANNMSMSSIIRPGQVLVVPEGTTSQTIQQAEPVDATLGVVPAGAITHVVKKGENLSRISAIYGVTVSQIMEWNGLSNPSLIRTGQPLIVSQSLSNAPEQTNLPDLKKEEKVVPAEEEAGSLQDFFNGSSAEDRPIIDAP